MVPNGFANLKTQPAHLFPKGRTGDAEQGGRFRDFAVPTICIKQGLSNANVFSVLAAKDGSIWLGTLDGLNRWNNGKVYGLPPAK